MSLFLHGMVTIDLTGIELQLRSQDDRMQVFDPVRRKWVVITPEEHVRQRLLLYMINKLGYPAGLIAVEKKVTYGNLTRRFDIVVYNGKHEPWMMVECKEPDVPLTEKALYQLLSYHRTIPCKFWFLSNGHQNYCADASDTTEVRWISLLPAYER
ncbi:MAG: type I restriction enzyme HsdR N-terminal domain-containing protein [Sphingobacteriales bacterium]|nr:MAG: type I restriction enzyme HsdR N-terminal domain-containing protein [Sphingobacteriales bacterium]